jgi:outer membrane protein assembly factor BamB
MLGQDAAHRSRSPVGRTTAPHRSWDLAVDGPVRGSCVIAQDGTIYAATSDTLYAVSPEGDVRWSSTAGAGDTSPAIGPDGTVYVVDGAALAAFDPTGARKWAVPLQSDGSLVSSPTVAPDGTVYVSEVDGPLVAVSPDGAIRWTGGDSFDLYSTAAIDAAGDVIVMRVSAYMTFTDAFSSAGTPGVHVPNLGAVFTYGVHPVVADDGTVFVPVSGGLVALSAAGTRLWTANWPGVGQEIAPATGADGTTYVVGSGAVVTALAAGGLKTWSYSGGGTDYGASVAVAADGTVYVGGTRLWMLDSTGRLQSAIDLDAPIESPLALDRDGTVVFGGTDGKVHAR